MAESAKHILTPGTRHLRPRAGRRGGGAGGQGHPTPARLETSDRHPAPETQRPAPRSRQQFVILKADDMVCDARQPVADNWQRFLRYTQERRIKASIGLVGRSLTSGDQAYCTALRALIHSGNFEIWNHGYAHTNALSNTPVTFQVEQLRRTQDLAREKLGITLRSFGAPRNAIDENTRLAIDQIPEIKVWLFGLEGSTKFVLRRSGEVEFPTRCPDFHRFLTKYRPAKPYIALQIHPNDWDAQHFEEFKRVIDYLVARESVFVTPYEYYLLTLGAG